MKKIIALALSLATSAMLVMSLSACGETKDETKLNSKVVNGVTLSVPSDYQDFQDKSGYMVASGPDASISVSPSSDAGGATPADFTEDTLKELYKSQFTNMVFKSIDKGTTKDGQSTVYATFTATSTSGKNLDIRLAIIFAADGKFHANYVMFTSGSNCSTSKFADEIMKSMTIAK